MKKFLKWSTAFLLLGVLAVGCIKNEASEGIEAMRKAKASLLSAQAELVQAKAQLEQAKAQVEAAKVAIVNAEADRIKAETELLKAEKAWQEALKNFHMEGWEIQIKEMEEDLRLRQAEVDKIIANWEVEMMEAQKRLADAQLAYQKSMDAIEKWKIANMAVLSEALINALDNLTDQMHEIMFEIAINQTRLNDAKGQYLFYVNATYANEIEVRTQYLEHRKLLLECDVDHLTAVVEAYTALYDNYHGELDALIAEFQATISFIREQIAIWEIEYLELQLITPPPAPSTAFLDRASKIEKKNVMIDVIVHEDGTEENVRGYDERIHVLNGNYVITGPWGSMHTMLARDIRIIKETRIGVDKTQLESEIEAKQKAKNKAWEDYETKWNAWQDNYKKVQPKTGELWLTWETEYKAYKAANKNRDEHVAKYGEMYADADSLIQLYMSFLNATLELNDGKLELPKDVIELSPVLGGIKFDITTLIAFIFGGNANAQALVDFVEALIGILNLPDQIDGIVTELKAIMDGTTAVGWDPFWDVAIGAPLGYKSTFNKNFGDIMRDVYGNQGREITDISKRDWQVWMVLYWLFQRRDVELGFDEYGTLISMGGYDNAGKKILEDFFGKYDGADYNTDVAATASRKDLDDAIKDYFKAAKALTDLEKDMYEPYNRAWSVQDKDGNVFTEANEKANPDPDPAKITKIVADPSTFSPEPYDHAYAIQPPAEDAEDFFFKIENYADESSPVPSLDLDDFLNVEEHRCDVTVAYRDLYNFSYKNCGILEEAKMNWVGDLLLWRLEYKLDGEYNSFKSGHFYYALAINHELKSIKAMIRRIEEGVYEALLQILEEEYAIQKAAYDNAVAAYNLEYAAYQVELATYLKLVAYRDGLGQRIINYEDAIPYYDDLIRQARKAHNGGNLADEGLLRAKKNAELRLMERQQELREVLAELEMIEQGLIPENKAAEYNAVIEVILDQIAILQGQLAALDAMRAKLLAEYEF